MKKKRASFQRSHWNERRKVSFLTLKLPTNFFLFDPKYQGQYFKYYCMLVDNSQLDIWEFICKILHCLQTIGCHEVANLNLQEITIREELFRRIEIHYCGMMRQCKISFWSEDEISCLVIIFENGRWYDNIVPLELNATEEEFTTILSILNQE